ncbi:class I SAM-dependent methyltransferase [Telmatospirillum sp. J64-1]|uniref:methyltransferase domain-containing protein n=1 Tax=Telmatospirillum sp. J64-1 TaxID=2502183 RepID=UPI00115ECBB9|nr:class I SAM-dependent methyltransferase [Telmatospirillum sp. J64-1]
MFIPRRTLSALCGMVAALSFPACASAQYELDVPFVPTPENVVQRMLTIADVQPDDILYDLGSGDGRIVIAAARDFGVQRGVGVDLDPERVQDGIENARQANVSDRVEFVEGNVFDFDFSDATVVTMYLLPSVNVQLRPRILEELRPGTRVVSHQFDMGDWEPDQSETVDGRSVHLWIVPADVAGRWQWQENGETFEVELNQQYQHVTGTLHAFGTEAPIENARLQGSELTFEARPQRDGQEELVRFAGTIEGEALQGDASMGQQTAAVTAERVGE